MDYITEVKYENLVFIVKYQEKIADGEYENRQRRSHEAPAASFGMATTRVARKVCEFYGWPYDYGENIRASKVSFGWKTKEGEKKLTSCTVKLLKPLEYFDIDSRQKAMNEVVITTPEIPEKCFPAGMTQALENLLKETERYIHGHRAQTKLFGDERTGAVPLGELFDNDDQEEDEEQEELALL